MWVGTLMSRHCLGQEGGERGIPGRGNRGAATVVSRRVEGAEAALRKGWGGWSRDGPRRPALPSQDESPSRGRRHATRRSLTSVVVGMGQGGDSDCKTESTGTQPHSDVRGRQ